VNVGNLITLGAARLDAMLGGTGTAAEMSVEHQEALYSLGRMLYEYGKAADAVRVFSVLVACDHTDRRYHAGLAASRQALGEHEPALRHWGLASLLDLTDPAAPMHAGECLLMLKRDDEARESLEYALAQAKAQPKHAALMERIEALLALMDCSPANPPKEEPCPAP